MRKLLILIIFFGIATNVIAQNIDEYKYILIPETYEFTGERDEYQLNSLTKFLFNKEGFNTLMTTGKKPEDLAKDPCLGLNTKLIDDSGLFVTKLVLVLEDCSGNEVFRSRQGESRMKDFKAAYHEALRDAFESIKELNYQYKPKTEDTKNSLPVEVSEPGREKAPEVIPEETEKVSDDNPQPDTLTVKSEPGQYRFEGQVYSVKTMNERLGLYQQNSPEPVAILIPSENGNYIYNSLTIQGVAYFTEQGDLVVEYFDSSKNEKVKRLYQVLDQ